MSKKMRVVLEITVDDLTTEARKECADGMECPVSSIPKMEDFEAGEIAHVFENMDEGEELFAGSDIYARFTDVHVASAEWCD